VAGLGRESRALFIHSPPSDIFTLLLPLLCLQI
jgi:hypothetical protein